MIAYDIIIPNNEILVKSEPNKEDICLEEITLQGIISSCENLLDDLDYCASIEEKDMQDLIYADNVILNIQQKVSKELNPTNINHE
jgi:hypothetical protein